MEKLQLVLQVIIHQQPDKQVVVIVEPDIIAVVVLIDMHVVLDIIQQQPMQHHHQHVKIVEPDTIVPVEVQDRHVVLELIHQQPTRHHHQHVLHVVEEQNIVHLDHQVVQQYQVDTIQQDVMVQVIIVLVKVNVLQEPHVLAEYKQHVVPEVIHQVTVQQVVHNVQSQQVL